MLKTQPTLVTQDMDDYKTRMILKRTAVVSASDPDCIYYINIHNGILYELNPKTIDNLKTEVIDATDMFTTLEQLQRESLKIMDEYIRVNSN